MIKNCPKSRCNGKLIEHSIHGLPAEEWQEDVSHICNKCGYVPSIEEYKKMADNEECVCLKGKNCCKCGKILEKDELIPRTDPYAEDMCNDHSEHLICYGCSCILAEDI